jgi:hypothetical protein
MPAIFRSKILLTTYKITVKKATVEKIPLILQNKGDSKLEIHTVSSETSPVQHLSKSTYMDNVEFLDSPVHLCFVDYTAQHATIHAALPGDRIWWRKVDVGGLLQESDLEVELLGNSLGRCVCVAWPHDILYVQTVLLP